MDIAVQKMILRMFSLDELAEMYPISKPMYCLAHQQGFMCLRHEDHTGLHVAHGLVNKAVHAWVNE
jgi:hypothetical protein